MLTWKRLVCVISSSPSFLQGCLILFPPLGAGTEEGFNNLFQALSSVWLEPKCRPAFLLCLPIFSGLSLLLCVCVCLYMGTHAFGGLLLYLGVIPQTLLPFCFRQGLSLKPWVSPITLGWPVSSPGAGIPSRHVQSLSTWCVEGWAQVFKASVLVLVQQALSDWPIHLLISPITMFSHEALLLVIFPARVDLAQHPHLPPFLTSYTHAGFVRWLPLTSTSLVEKPPAYQVSSSVR